MMEEQRGFGRTNIGQNPEEKDELKELIKETFQAQVREIEMTDPGCERMKDSVYARIEEESKMRKFMTKKLWIAVAAACVFGSITAIAAGKVAYTSGHSSHDEEVAQYAQLADLESQVGFQTGVPEAFSNGYTFASARPTHNKAMDQDGNVIQKSDDLSLTYGKEGMPDIHITVEGTKTYAETSQVDQTFEWEGISLGYSSDHYRFVPPDYQITAEEQEKVDAGELYISYGSSEVEDKVTKSIVWKSEGLTYCVLTFDNPLSAEDLYQMACEIITFEAGQK